MAVQDDRRELEMIRIGGLTRGAGRFGVDAFYDFEEAGTHYSVPLELKSTTSRSVSTARDVGLAHVAKWRSRVWLFGFYDKGGVSLESLLILGPTEMEPWIARIESYIAPDIRIGDRLASRLELEDVYVVCGEKDVYSRDDAKSLHKRQWSKERYKTEMDIENGYSPDKMLHILRLRAQYLIARGATLNNPRIPRSFFAPFKDRELIKHRSAERDLQSAMQNSIKTMTLGNRKLRDLARISD